MPNADELFPDSQYLKSPDVLSAGGEMILTIKEASRKVYTKDGKQEVKGLLSFVETPKQLTTNVTNTRTLIALFGKEDYDTVWVGKKVTLYVEHDVQGPNGLTDGIRIRNGQKPADPKVISEYWSKIYSMKMTNEEGLAHLAEFQGDYAAATAGLSSDGEPTSPL